MHAPRALRSTLLALALALHPLAACASTPPVSTLVVTATAYNSLPAQTGDDHPSIAAWGDRLEPGMKAIAVSRDLQNRGLTRGTVVRIEGLEGEYVVLDRMHARWDKRIDIYMGEDVRAARHWGVREVRIHWAPVAD